MRDEDKPKEELLSEVAALRGRIAEPESPRLPCKPRNETIRLAEFSLDRTGEAIFWIGADGRFSYANDAACRSLGYSREQLLSMRLHQIDPNITPEAWPDHWKEVKARGCLTFESVHRAKDGRVFPVEITVHHLELDGNEHHCAFVRDVTMRKRAEQREEQNVRDLAFLSKTAMGLVGLPADEDIYRFLGERLRDLLPEAIVLVNSYERESDSIHLGIVLGLGKDTEKLVKILGRSPAGITFRMNNEARAALASAKLHKVPGGAHELTFRRLPKSICIAIEKSLGLGEIYSIGLFREGELFGDVIIIMRQGKPLSNPEIVETVINQAAVAMHRKRAEEKEKLCVRTLQLLSNSAMQFVELPPDEDVYHFIGERLRELIGDPVVLVNSYDPTDGSFCCRAVLGTGNRARTIARILGRDPIGMSLKMDGDFARAKLPTRELARVPGGLYELCFGRVPRIVCDAVEKLLNIGKIYAMGVSREGQLFGSAVIMMHKGTHLANKGVVETFINQASVALQHRQAEEGLAKERNLLRTLIDNLPDCHIFVKDPQSRFVTTNTAHLRTLGAEKLQDVVGKTDADFFPSELAGQYYSDEQGVILSGQPLLNREELVIDKEGRKRWFLTTKVPLRDSRGVVVGLVGISRDITGRRRAEEALKDSEALYHSLVESLPQNILRKDREGRFTFANTNFCSTLGKTLDQVLGKTDFDFYPRQLAEKYTKDDRRVVETGKILEDIEEHHTPDGRKMYVQVVKTPVYDSQGGVTGVQVIFWDVTDRKRAEEESRTLARLGVRLAGAATRESMIPVMREETDRLLGWDAHFFAVRRPDEETFHVVSFVDTVDGKKKTFDKENWPPERLSRPVRVVLEGHPVLINRTPENVEPILSPFGYEDRRSASLMYVPVRSGENVIGILSVQSYTYGRYNEADLQTLQRIADAVAPALERAHAAEALRESEERYRNLVESLNEGIWAIDAESRTTFVNARMAEMLAYTADEMLGKHLFSFMDEGEVETCKYYLDRRQRAIKEQHDFEFRRKDGTPIYTTLDTSPLTDTDGNYAGAIAAVTDITARKRAEEEKLRLQEQLAHAQKMEALGTLAGGIAHEFNNINAIIIGYVDLISQSEVLSDTALRNLETIRASASRGAALTRSLLAFSRKEVGDKKPVELKNVVDAVLKVTEKEFTSEGIEVVVRHSMRLPPVMGDSGMLESVVMNLVINARHAVLKSAVKKLTIQTGSERGRPFIRVSDTGCGIPKRHLSRVFEPFFTTKGSLASGQVYDGKTHGTGLGLSVCHSIVEGHGGEITLSSRVGKGTTFTVYLPPAADRIIRRERPETDREKKRQRILIVDDEKPITDLLEDILCHAGYAAEGFTNPRQALKALSQKQYSLALIDLQMPQMAGEDFIERIDHLRPENRPVKVILTGRLDTSEADRAASDIFATLVKPFDNQEIITTVRKALATRAARSRQGTPRRKARER